MVPQHVEAVKENSKKKIRGSQQADLKRCTSKCMPHRF